MAAQGSDASKLREDLARIRAHVEAGNADLSALGFWSIVSRVKRDPALVDALAEEIGEIDRLAFEARHRFRPAVGVGNLVLLLGVGLAKLALWVAYDLAAEGYAAWIGYGPAPPDTPRFGDDAVWPGLLLLGAAGALTVAIHDLAHWAWGRMGGMTFRGYFLDGPFRIQPGIKTDYASYLRARPEARARMHAAGAVASKVAPFVVFAAAYLAHRSHDYALYPSWSLWALLAFGVLQIVTDVAWSTKGSDWKKWARERRVAADLYSRGTPGSSARPG